LHAVVQIDASTTNVNVSNALAAFAEFEPDERAEMRAEGRRTRLADAAGQLAIEAREDAANLKGMTYDENR
jgi:hypothetical protein